MKVKYKAIYEDMRNRIESGEYQVGDLIPDEITMGRRFGCSRMTVKKAYDILVNEGYIYRRQGQGSFVLSHSLKNEKKIEIQERDLTGFSRGTQGEGQAKLLRFQLIFANEEIAQHLKIRVNDPVYDILRVRLLKDRPYVIEQTYMPPALIPGVTEEILNGSLYTYIEETLGLRIGAAQKTTWADKSNEIDQQELWLKETEPVLVIEQVAFLDNAVPFEYSISRHHYDLFRFSVYSVRH